MLADCNAYNFFFSFLSEALCQVRKQKCKISGYNVLRWQCMTKETRRKFLPLWKFSEAEILKNYIKMDLFILIFCWKQTFEEFYDQTDEINRLFAFSLNSNDDFSNSNNYFTIILLRSVAWPNICTVRL